MPQPSECGPVWPPRRIRPAKLKQISVGTLAFMPRSSHMSRPYENSAWLSRGLLGQAPLIDRHAALLTITEDSSPGRPGQFRGAGGLSCCQGKRGLRGGHRRLDYMVL